MNRIYDRAIVANDAAREKTQQEIDEKDKVIAAKYTKITELEAKMAELEAEIATLKWLE
jgi:peptidoglycan hydrolase CwlO-like protein